MIVDTWIIGSILGRGEYFLFSMKENGLTQETLPVKGSEILYRG